MSLHWNLLIETGSWECAFWILCGVPPPLLDWDGLKVRSWGVKYESYVERGSGVIPYIVFANSPNSRRIDAKLATGSKARADSRSEAFSDTQVMPGADARADGSPLLKRRIFHHMTLCTRAVAQFGKTRG